MYWRDARWTLKRTSEPSIEPVTVDEARMQCRVDTDDENDLLRSYVKAAREMVEIDAQRALITQTWQLKLDGFPCDVIEVRRPPVSSVSSVAYVDTNGDSQTLATTYYNVDTNSEPGRITLAYSQTYPATRSQDNAVTVTFVAGYGSLTTSVPEAARQAIRLLVGHWYNNREAVGRVGDEVAMAYCSLIDRIAWSGYR